MKIIKPLRAGLIKLLGTELPHWTSLALWIIGIAVMIGLTVKDLIPIIVGYMNQDTNVAIQIGAERKNFIKPPQLFLCMRPGSLHYELQSELAFLNHFCSHNATDELCTVFNRIKENGWNLWKHENMSSPRHELNVTIFAENN